MRFVIAGGIGPEKLEMLLASVAKSSMLLQSYPTRLVVFRTTDRIEYALPGNTPDMGNTRTIEIGKTFMNMTMGSSYS